MLRVDHDPGPETVSHHSAGHLARRSSLQRFDDLEPIVIRQPDVKDQMHVILSGIDVCDQGINASIGIRQQSPAVTTQGFKTVHRVADAEEMRVTLRDLRL